MTHPWHQLAEAVQICTSTREKNNLIGNALTNDKPYVMSFVNVHALNLLKKNTKLKESLHLSDVVLRDGIGLQIFYKMHSMDPGMNMNGTDLIPEILSCADRSKCIALYGTVDPWLDKAAGIIRKMGFSHIHTIDGFQDEQQYLNHALTHKPDIVILAMGMPKQEALAIQLKYKMKNHPVLIINGGAILDFMSKRHPRAPLLFQKLGVEWLYRLAREPKRLWRRNFGSVTFVTEAAYLAIKTRIKNRRNPV